MKCEAIVIEDSINPRNEVRLTTLQLRYWRSIHSEFMTHRVFSRNASSSRAIPINTFLKQVWNDPAGPSHWGSNQPGMKARQELSGFKKWFAKKMWNLAGKLCCIVVGATRYVSNPHKQVFNRILEPWQYISVVVTATEWDNFFELRDHPDAQPEIKELAIAIKKAMDESLCRGVEMRELHLPYVSFSERIQYSPEVLYKLSSARCARVSYLTHDGKVPVLEKDIALHDALVGSRPIHASPTEHCAFAAADDKFYKNFKGWVQYRVEVENKINKE